VEVEPDRLTCIHHNPTRLIPTINSNIDLLKALMSWLSAT